MERLSPVVIYKGPGDPFVIEWAKQRIGTVVAGNDHPEIPYAIRFGNPTRQTKTLWFWELDNCQVTIHKTKKALTLTWEAKTCDPLEALDAVQNHVRDLGTDDSPLSGREIFSLYWMGRNAIEPHRIKLAPMPDIDLRNFVRQYCDGRIFTDRHCDPSMVGSVFMVLMFGALQPSEDTVKAIKPMLPPEAGDKPAAPTKPAMPEEIKPPEEPVKPKPLEPDPKVIQNIENDIEWQTRTKEDIHDYMESLKKRQEELDAEYTKAHAEWETRCLKIRGDHAEKHAQWAKDMEAYNQAMNALAGQMAEWKLAKARHNEAWRGVIEGHTQEIGIIWESMDKAGPMSVNGCPIFLSLHIMGKSDWNRAIEAIKKETKHRERMKV